MSREIYPERLGGPVIHSRRLGGHKNEMNLRSLELFREDLRGLEVRIEICWRR